MKRLALLTMFILLSFILNAQSVIPATGGNAIGAGGSVSYTVGQVVYTTNTGTAVSVSQGVQQPYEISVVTGIEEAMDIFLICAAYPNPVSDFLNLKVENYENLSYKLFDSNGILLESKKVSGNETRISMAKLIPSVYLLKVMKGYMEVRTFKIIKN